MGSIYKKGRPNRTSYDDTRKIPKEPGEYRIWDTEKKSAYIGETNNLRRRMNEHKRGGKFLEGETVDYMLADKRSTSRTRRLHERKSIEKYQPYRNKSIGGEGKRAGTKNKPKEEYYYDEHSSGGDGGFFKRLLFGLLQIVFVLLMLAIAALIVYEGWDLQLMVWPLGFLGIYILLKKFIF